MNWRIWAIALIVASGGCTGAIVDVDGDLPDPGPPLYPAHHEMPSWSSQDAVAYVDNGVVEPTDAGIWVLEHDRGEASQLLPYGLCPGWSPDGASLVFSAGGQILTIESDGSELTQLTSYGANFFPDWSPDGEQLAWERSEGAPEGVWVMLSDGGGKQLLIPEGNEPDWHHSGNRMLYSGWIDSLHAGISEYNIAEGSSVPLRVHHVSEMTHSGSARYSPDGSRIAFVSWVEASLGQIWVMNADGTELRQLTSSGGSYPSWSPDGSKVVHTRENRYSDALDDGVLWVIDVDTGEEYQLTFKK